jgi:hydantoinase/carbamoylase family amidase
MNARAFDATAAGREILARAEALSRHSDSPDHYTRTWLTPAHRTAAAQIGAWMREAGMAVRTDGVGNVIGRYEGASPGAKALVTGSHYDSVRNGGRYDGILGILVPIACVADLHARGERLPHAVEVVAFADEEGARFQTSFLASRAFLGRFDPALLERRDRDGVRFDEAMRAAGLDPAAIAASPRDPATIAAYVEVHIEQGPVLLQEGLPLGVVTAIAGGTRFRVKVTGAAGHAGTVPMAMRHDALAAAADMVLAVEARAKSGGGLVGTVGILEVKDGTGNVIPGEVEFTVDIRSGDDAVREAAERAVFERFEAIAARRGVRVAWNRTHAVRATPCSGRVQQFLADSIAALGIPVRRLASGAGHDAMVLAEACEVGMLFVRCGAGGVSHNPAETVTTEDAGLAVAALREFIARFGPAS